MELTHFSLFSGIGGFDLAAEWAGFRTVGQVEKNPYRRRVLRKHWPDVPMWEDIRDVTEETLANTIISGRGGEIKCEETQGQKTERSAGGVGRRSDAPRIIEEKRARIIPPVTLVTGGFPCQSFSVAGKRRGTADDRYLWPEMLRVIRLVRPRWVLAENVAGIVRMALNTVLSDLESEGYSVQAFNIPACAVNAPHRRERIWIVAHSGDKRRGGRNNGDAEREIGPLQAEGPSPTDEQELLADAKCGEVGDRRTAGQTSDEGGRNTQTRGAVVCPGKEIPFPGDLGQGGKALAHPKGGRLRPQLNKIAGEVLPENRSPQEPESRNGYIPDPQKQGLEGANREGNPRPDGRGVQCLGGDWWTTEPDVGRVAHGVPSRVDRLSALGDAIVPQVAYRILKVIAEIEESMWTQ